MVISNAQVYTIGQKTDFIAEPNIFINNNYNI